MIIHLTEKKVITAFRLNDSALIERDYFHIIRVLHTFYSCLQQTVMPEPGGGGQGGHWPPPQYLADQLTLFQPGEGRLSPPITSGPPKFFHLLMEIEYV